MEDVSEDTWMGICDMCCKKTFVWKVKLGCEIGECTNCSHTDIIDIDYSDYVADKMAGELD